MSQATFRVTVLPSALRELRIAAGLSQKELAERANCSPQFVHLLESGYRPMTSRVLEAILDAIGGDLVKRPESAAAALRVVEDTALLMQARWRTEFGRSSA